LAISIDLFFAGAIADIAPKLRSVFSQLLIIPAQLLAALFDFISRIANVFEILSNLRFIMVAPVVITNIAPVVLLVMPSIMTFPTAVARISSAIMAFPPIVAQISPTVKLPVTVALTEMMMSIAILSVSCRGYPGDDKNPRNHCAQNDSS
jgi:hypothetical protein